MIWQFWIFYECFNQSKFVIKIICLNERFMQIGNSWNHVMNITLSCHKVIKFRLTSDDNKIGSFDKLYSEKEQGGNLEFFASFDNLTNKSCWHVRDSAGQQRNFQSCFFLIFLSEWLKSPLPSLILWNIPAIQKRRSQIQGRRNIKTFGGDSLLGVDGGLNMPLLIGIGLIYLPKIGRGPVLTSLYVPKCLQIPCDSLSSHHSK